MQLTDYYLKPIGFKHYENPNCVRYASIIKGNESLRRELTDIFEGYNNSPDTIKEKLAEFGIFLFDEEKSSSNIVNNKSNCQTWAFNYLGLPNYSLADEALLIKGDSNELRCIKEPEDGALVLYLMNLQSSHIRHRGVISEINKVVKIISKWGKGDTEVYSHNLELTPSYYGNYVMFFRKV